MRRTLARAFSGVAYHSGALRLAARLAEPPGRTRVDGRFQILTYHRVGAAADPLVRAVVPAVFERQMRYLRRHFQVLSLRALLQAVRQGQLPSRAIAVTFDDGYEDTYRYALPIASRCQVPITVFLATGFIDADRPMWNDVIAAAIRDTECAELGGLPDRQLLPLVTTTDRQQALSQAITALKYRPPTERESLVNEITHNLKVRNYSGPRMLRWPQIEEMCAQGVDFGAHTVNHPILTSVPPAERWQEIIGSKRAIEERLQMPVMHFAYPNGKALDFDETTKTLLKQAGFSAAVSTIFGTNTPDTDPYELRRGGVWEERTALFATQLWWNRCTTLDGGPVAGRWNRSDCITSTLDV